MTIKTVETENEGLKRAFMLTIPAEDIEARVEVEVKRLAPQIRMPGFRGAAVWCGRRDSNPHGFPLGPKPSASTSFATPARTPERSAAYNRDGPGGNPRHPRQPRRSAFV